MYLNKCTPLFVTQGMIYVKSDTDYNKTMYVRDDHRKVVDVMRQFLLRSKRFR